MTPAYFDARRGTLSAAVFSDPAIHRAELASVFRRHWLFLGPAAWAGAPGDWFTTRMGDTPVMVWHGPAGVAAFVNRCLGSDRALVAEGRGTADRLRCGCHGWSYAPVAVPGAAAPDRVPRVEEHAGLLFANFAEEAPAFAAALGDFAPYLDAIVASLPGGIGILGEAPLITRLAANWKLAAEAYSGDLYRDFTVTRGTREALGDAPLGEGVGFQAATDRGAIVLAQVERGGGGESPLAGMRPVSATLFPNLSYDGRGHALHVWSPCGPEDTEGRSYALAGAHEAAEGRAARLRQFQRRFGPAGLETEDHEGVWAAATRASRGLLARAAPLNLQMGLGRERRTNLPGLIGDYVSEGNQRQFYAWWDRECRRTDAVRRAPRRLRLVRPDIID